MEDGEDDDEEDEDDDSIDNSSSMFSDEDSLGSDNGAAQANFEAEAEQTFDEPEEEVQQTQEKIAARNNPGNVVSKTC